MKLKNHFTGEDVNFKLEYSEFEVKEIFIEGENLYIPYMKSQKTLKLIENICSEVEISDSINLFIMVDLSADNLKPEFAVSDDDNKIVELLDMVLTKTEQISLQWFIIQHLDLQLTGGYYE